MTATVIHLKPRPAPKLPAPTDKHDVDAAASTCPVCGERLVAQRCKLYCKSSKCVNLVVMSCAD